MALKHYPAGMWRNNNRPCACGLCFIGRKMVRLPELTALQALGALLQAILVEAENWG